MKDLRVNVPGLLTMVALVGVWEALVRFRATSKADADRLWAEIQRMPELTPYELRVVIKAAEPGR